MVQEVLTSKKLEKTEPSLFTLVARSVGFALGADVARRRAVPHECWELCTFVGTKVFTFSGQCAVLVRFPFFSEFFGPVASSRYRSGRVSLDNGTVPCLACSRQLLSDF